MNDFEKKLIADLASGKSAEALLAEFNTALVAAKKAEEERQKKIAEEKRIKEEEARKAKAEKEREVKSKRIVELANRALNDQITAEDVAWLMTQYVAHKYPKRAEELGEIINAKDVDSMIDLAVKLMDTADSMFGTVWAKPVGKKDPVSFTMKIPSEHEIKSKNNKSDDEVICDFINKILH
jgi:leucyl aminopeptidase (aminopeptidase T)